MTVFSPDPASFFCEKNEEKIFFETVYKTKQHVI